MDSRYSGLKVLPETQAEIQSPVLVKLHYYREIGKMEQGKKFLQVMTQRFHYRVGWVYGSEPEMRKNGLVDGGRSVVELNCSHHGSQEAEKQEGTKGSQPVKGMNPSGTYPSTRPSLPAFYLQLTNANLQSVHGLNLWNPFTGRYI